MFFKALIVFSDRYSWINPTDITIKIITRMVYAVTDLPTKKEMNIATASKYTIKLLLICLNRIFKGVVLEISLISFRPYFSSLFSASFLVKPFSLNIIYFKIIRYIRILFSPEKSIMSVRTTLPQFYTAGNFK